MIRPLLDLMNDRSKMDWGEAPKYNLEYRKIRWPKSIIQNTIPGWMINLNVAIRNRAIKGNNLLKKAKARISLREDLEFCMSENIPFKTKSIEYNCKDQWVYICGDKTIRYSIVNGCLTEFTYSGVYNKVKTLILRELFGIVIVLKGRRLEWYTDLDLGSRYTDLDLGSRYTDLDLGSRYTNLDINSGYTRKGTPKIEIDIFSSYRLLSTNKIKKDGEDTYKYVISHKLFREKHMYAEAQEVAIW